MVRNALPPLGALPAAPGGRGPMHGDAATTEPTGAGWGVEEAPACSRTLGKRRINVRGPALLCQSLKKGLRKELVFSFVLEKEK